MIVLIDNYDSFSYNVYQLIGSVKPDIKVVRNDEVTIKELEAMKPEALILSPGPGKPEDAGICIESIKYFKDKLPILGICLGHQSICEAFGGTVSYAKELMHGKQKEIRKRYIKLERAGCLKDFRKLFRQPDITHWQLSGIPYRRNWLLPLSLRTER